MIKRNQRRAPATAEAIPMKQHTNEPRSARRARRSTALGAGLGFAVLAVASTARADEPAAQPPVSPAPQTAPPASPAPQTAPPASPPPQTAPPLQTAPPASPAPQTAPPASPAPQTAPPASPAQQIVDEDGEPRLSLPTAGDRAAWRTSGFRLGLGLVYGRFIGLGGAPSGRLLGPTIRIGVRLDENWSVFTSFQYAAASQDGGLSGLRFAGTLDPTWHVTSNLSIAAGFGFGGIVEGSTGRMDAEPLRDTLETSYTFPDARRPIASCSGVGASGLLRIEWGYVLGPRSQTSVALEAVGQWTACTDDTNRVDPNSGSAIIRRQYWPHTGATLAWGITWR